MGDKTSIEWTEATWNPTTGCDRVSPGCDSCYALGQAARLKLMGQPKYQRDGDPRTSGPGFALTVHPDTLDIPLRWARPRRIFVNSMSDLFHRDVLNAMDDEGAFPFLAHVVAVMVIAKQHTFQVLTKRPHFMRAVLSQPKFRLDVNAILLRRRHPVMPGGMTDPNFRWPSNIWWGTSIETDRYSFRADHLRETPAAVRFLSLEPLLGALPSLDLTGIDWVIVGGESGPHARPMHPDWARDIRDRCATAGVPYFFKQWGAWWPGATTTPASRSALGHGHFCADAKFLTRSDNPDSRVFMANVGRSRAGRELDGRTWDEFPTPATVGA